MDASKVSAGLARAASKMKKHLTHELQVSERPFASTCADDLEQFNQVLVRDARSWL